MYVEKINNILERKEKSFSMSFPVSFDRFFYAEPYVKNNDDLKSICIRLEQDLNHFYRKEFADISNTIGYYISSLKKNKQFYSDDFSFDLPYQLFKRKIAFNINVFKREHLESTRIMYSKRSPVDLQITKYFTEHPYGSLAEIKESIIDKYLIEKNLILKSKQGLVNLKKRRTRFAMQSNIYIEDQVLPNNILGLSTYFMILSNVLSNIHDLFLTNMYIGCKNIKHQRDGFNKYKDENVYRIILNPLIDKPSQYFHTDQLLFRTNDGKRFEL